MEILPAIVRILQVVLGVGLVIFVHEWGHFIAARWCGVRVDIFSIGMGPKIFGWKRGDTTYQIGALPIGGYVRWAGEEWNPEDGPPPADNFAAKTIGQRFLMYSGGVIMNLLFGLIVFPILFWNGVDFVRPAVGNVAPGSPAWHAQIPTGAEVLTVNGDKIYEFSHLFESIALGDPANTELVYRDPETGQETTVQLTPDTSGGIPLIGVGQPIKSDAAGNPVVGVQEGSPAWIAGLRNGDTLLSFVDPIPGVSLWDEFRERITEGQTLRLRVIGEDGDRVIEFDARKLEIDPNASPLIGVRPPLRSVGAVRQGSKLPLDLREGDRILSINGQRILRLGDYHRVIQDLTDAVAMGIERPLAGGVDTGILAGHPGWEQLVLSSPPLDSVGRQALIDDVAMTLDLESGIVVPQNGRVAAEIGLLDGDLVRSVDGVRIASWTELTNAIGIAGKESRAAAFEVTRLDNAGAPTDLVFQVQGRPTAATEHGVEILPDEYLFRTDGFIASIEAGTTFSWRFLQNTWLTLKRIILGSVRARDAIGGPVSIATISYRVAEQGLAKLFFFLCMLSINLAFLNILPIPILDGGHLFFLLVEKVKGSPVSDRVLGYSQLIGIVLILSLFVFVTYNDLARWVFN